MPQTMNTITEQNWEILRQVRAELKLDKEPPEPAQETDEKKYYHFRDAKTGALLRYSKTPGPRAVDPRKPRPGEMSVKEWSIKESARSGYAVNTIRIRFYDGYYDDRLTHRRVDAHTSYVKEKPQSLTHTPLS